MKILRSHPILLTNKWVLSVIKVMEYLFQNHWSFYLRSLRFGCKMSALTTPLGCPLCEEEGWKELGSGMRIGSGSSRTDLKSPYLHKKLREV
jgi:hypothetical protein